MELVTEPHTFENSEETAKKASKFAKELQLILWYLDVSEANMEKGEMRVEANISISFDPKKLGTKVEVKNLNSFRSVERAIKYELDRMTQLQEEGKGNEIVQETRGWDESKQKTFSQRKKESSEDYRYFPEPDLPKLKLQEAFDLEKMKKDLPELPQAKRLRYKKDFRIKEEDIESYINNIELGKYFELVTGFLRNKDHIILASNFISNDLLGSARPVSEFIDPGLLAETIIMIYNGELSSRAAKDIISVAKDFKKGKKIREYAIEKDLLQKNDTNALKQIAQKIIDANQKVVADYKGGKENALMSLVGQIMKETKGSANPSIAKQILIDLLVRHE
jgi:aspartyl-tRNA(Asn)/glutamyl-tRNA(Gln) amidotransferase subunit B